MSEAKMSTTVTPKQFYRRILPEKCLSFSSEEGKTVFAEALAAGYMNTYFGLASQFRTQDEPAFCGLSTLVMVLNTLEIDPKKVWKGPWRWYHENMLDCCVPLEVVKTAGINLEQFACLAACNTLSVIMTRVDPQASIQLLRDKVKECTRQTDQILVASYSRKVLGQTGDGHFSPIGGYHPERDLVLILDTARFKYPPHWIHLTLLWEAMQAADQDTALPRGYFILSKTTNSPLVMFRTSPELSITAPKAAEVHRRLNNFDKRWETYLCSDAVEDATSEESILKTAVAELLYSLKELQDICLLSTQVDTRCCASLSDEHFCVLETLLLSLEGTGLFTVMQECLAEKPELREAVTHAGKLGTNYSACSHSDGRPPNNTCTIAELTDVHFATMLLLSWPLQKCGNSAGQAIQTMLTSQLSSCNSVLQNEVLLLRQQFELVFGYIDKCKSCECKA